MVALTLLAFPVAALVIWSALRSPLASRIVAAPVSERWHVRETPLLGGVGIFAGLVVGVAAAAAAGAVPREPELYGILGGAALLFTVGLADDAVGLGPAAKLAAQLGAVVIVLSSGLSVEVVGNDVIATAIAVVWLVGMTNAFNLLDNMDGIAATLAGIACAFFAIDAVTEHPSRLVLVVALAGALACAGFLPFNVRPGRPAAVFMGDSGAQVLGFTLGALALAASWKVAAPSLATVLLPVLVLAVPILDTTLVTILRLIERRPVHVGGRDHTTHRLVYRGLSERHALVVLAALAAALGATSLAYNAVGSVQLTLVGVLVTFAVVVQFAGYLAETDDAGGAAPALSLRKLAFPRPRRLAEVGLDFILVSAAFAGAYLLRFEGLGPREQRDLFFDALPVILAARYAVFLLLGLYSTVWRYAGARDVVRIAVAVLASEGVGVALLAVSEQHSFGTFSRSVFVIDALLCTLLVGASRLAERAVARPGLAYRGPRHRTLIVGAGRAGRSLMRELGETPGEKVVAFLDDNPDVARRRVHGVPVVGGLGEIEHAIRRTRPDAVVVSIPDAPRERLEPVLEACERAGVPCRIIRRETVAASLTADPAAT